METYLFNINLNSIYISKYIYAIVIFLFFQLFRVALRNITYKFVKKTSTQFDDDILDVIKKPVDYLFVAIGLHMAKNILTIPQYIDNIITHLLNSFFIVVIFWGIINILNHLSVNIHQFTNRFGDKISADVANFIVKSIRFFLILLSGITVLQEWGYNISGFIASLGLVGMAFALAAKDTASNLFGSLVIFTDRPFRVGDWIKTPEVEGTVESVGIRSTKVRTFAQALVSVPNGTLANSAILNWSKMGKRRIKTTIGLVYNTSSDDLQNILQDIRMMLQTHPDIDQETIYVYFSDFAQSSLNIFCYYFTKTTNWGEFMAVKEDTYFKIIDIVQKHNSSFAFPTQTIYLEQNDKFD